MNFREMMFGMGHGLSGQSGDPREAYDKFKARRLAEAESGENDPLRRLLIGAGAGLAGESPQEAYAAWKKRRDEKEAENGDGPMGKIRQLITDLQDTAPPQSAQDEFGGPPDYADNPLDQGIGSRYARRQVQTFGGKR